MKLDHPPLMYIARHAETVYNHDHRMQGNDTHTPLTRHGIAQAEALGRALREFLVAHGEVVPEIWSSPAGRTLQTAAIICEYLGQDFFAIRRDPRLREIEIGRWCERRYADIVAVEGEIIDRERHLFRMPIPDGEHYVDMEQRLRSWLMEIGDRPMLVISHGITTRVLRGILAGGEDYAGVTIGADLPQGSLVRIEGGREEVILRGSGWRRGEEAKTPGSF